MLTGGGSELALHVLQSLHCRRMLTYAMSLIAVVRIQLLETRLPQHGALQSEDDSAAGALQQRQGRSGMRVIVDIAGGSPLPDGPAVVGALQLLCTCIGSSAPPLTGRAGLLIASGTYPDVS